MIMWWNSVMYLYYFYIKIKGLSLYFKFKIKELKYFMLYLAHYNGFIIYKKQ